MPDPVYLATAVEIALKAGDIQRAGQASGFRIDKKGTIDLVVPDAELAVRQAARRPRKTDYNAGAIWKYAQLVGPAHLGALTHPGAEAETHCYADI